MIVLSIIIITHNQLEDFRRCIESILCQDLPFGHEIIVSDDMSSDGTYELAKEYEIINQNVKVLRCDSSNASPSMVSERAAYNRLNGLKSSSGKYVYHIDGDDYLLNNSCLKRQVDFLEEHIECSIVCQNFNIVERGALAQTKRVALNHELFRFDRVVSVDSFIIDIPYIHNSACCMRREKRSVVGFSPCYYDDVDITFSYINRGKIGLIDCCDFVYVHSSSCTASCFQSAGQNIVWLSCLTSSLIAPQCAGSLLRARLYDILHVVNMARHRVSLDNNIIDYLNKFPIFLFTVFNPRRNPFKKIRLFLLWIWIHILVKSKLDFDICYRILYLLAIGHANIDNACVCRCE